MVSFKLILSERYSYEDFSNICEQSLQKIEIHEGSLESTPLIRSPKAFFKFVFHAKIMNLDKFKYIRFPL
jgi:hypothetical protein